MTLWSQLIEYCPIQRSGILGRSMGEALPVKGASNQEEADDHTPNAVQFSPRYRVDLYKILSSVPMKCCCVSARPYY
jgi:hypothetical protein